MSAFEGREGVLLACFFKIIVLRRAHDPEKWLPVFGQDHA